MTECASNTPCLKHVEDATMAVIFQSTFVNEKVWISIIISLKFVTNGPINDMPRLVQIMAWRRPGDAPLSEPMMINLLTHICIIPPHWVNKTFPTIKKSIISGVFRWHWGVIRLPQCQWNDSEKHIYSTNPIIISTKPKLDQMQRNLLYIWWDICSTRSGPQAKE